MQIATQPALKTIQQLCAPFGISVATNAAAAKTVIPTFNINFGETPAEIIDRLCRYLSLLYFDDTAGNLILAQVAD